MLRYSAPILLVLTMACASELSSNGKSDDVDTASEMLDTDDSEGTDINENDNPTYWSLDGAWQIDEGTIVLAGSTLELSFWSSEDSKCSYFVEIDDAQSAFDLRPDPSLFGWWTISFTYTTDKVDCDWTIKGEKSDIDALKTLHIGIGPFDKRLESALSASGTDPNNSSTHALFIADPQNLSNLLVFGVAGTEAQYTDLNGFDNGNPLQSDTYLLTALYLFPY